MKLEKLLILFLNFIAFAASKISKSFVTSDTLFDKAVESLITSFFIPYGYVSIRVLVANSGNKKVMDIAKEIIKQTSEIKFYIKTLDDGKGYEEKRRSPIVLLFDSFEEFENVKKVLASDYAKYFLVILPEGIFDGFDEVLKYFWKNSALDVNFMVTDESKFSLLTYFPYNEGRCGEKLELKVLNIFDSKREKWINDQFYPSKVKNLQGCTLNIAITLGAPFTMEHSENKTHYGVDVDMINEMGKLLNFENVFDAEYSTAGDVYENGSSSGALGSLWKNKNDIAIGHLPLLHERFRFLPISPVYLYADLIIIMPKPLPISAIEKLYMPFDRTIWIFFLLMCIFGVFVIVLSNLKSKRFYELIVGKNTNQPILNMLIAIFGMSQKNLPRGNFARFLLAKFLILCLVIRTLYQQKLFDLMQTDLLEREPKTVEDLIAKNFNFYFTGTLARQIDDERVIKRVKIVTRSQQEEYRSKTLDPHFKGVVTSFSHQVAYFNSFTYKNYVYLVCKEKYLKYPIVYYFKPRYFMTDIISEKLTLFREFGIVEYIIERYVDLKFLITPPEERRCVPLTFKAE